MEPGGYMLPEGRFARSWRLTKVAWAVIRGDRTLLALAAITGVATAALLTAYFWCAGLLDDPGSRSRWTLFVWLVAFLWPFAFVATFTGTALAAAGAAALDGGRRLTLGEALLVPVRRIRAVLGWSLLSAGVGLVLQGLADRIPFGGRVIAWFGGVAWELATLFAVPLLVLEDAGPLRAARRSGELIRERWGEALGGTVTISAWAAIPGLVGGALIGGAAVSHGAARLVLAACAIAVFAAVIGLTSATRELFGVALYRYAIDPATATAAGGAFPVADLADPPARKRKRRWGRNRDRGNDRGPDVR
jgi:hypothetical protein